jgi:hypothetical protein
MREFFAHLILLVSLPCTAFAANDKPLISLREDFSGHAMQTRELVLRENGAVIVESYDFYKAPQDSWHTVVVIRKIPQREIWPLVERVSALAASLPKLVDEERSIPLDPESRVIQIKSEEGELFSGWAAYKDAPASTESKAFQNAWDTIEALLIQPRA